MLFSPVILFMLPCKHKTAGAFWPASNKWSDIADQDLENHSYSSPRLQQCQGFILPFFPNAVPFWSYEGTRLQVATYVLMTSRRGSRPCRVAFSPLATDQKPGPHQNGPDPYPNGRFGKNWWWAAAKLGRAVFVDHRKSPGATFSTDFAPLFPSVTAAPSQATMLFKSVRLPESLETSPSIAQRFFPISCQNSVHQRNVEAEITHIFKGVWADTCLS